MAKERKKLERLTPEQREKRLLEVREIVTRIFRRSEAVADVMEKYGMCRSDATQWVIAAEDAIAAEWGETETERIRGRIAQIFEAIARNPNSNEKVRASAASSLARLIGANRPKIVRVESSTDEALDALLREQLEKIEKEDPR